MTQSGPPTGEQQQGELSHSLSESQARDAETHRGFVREMDRTLGQAYGTGGGVVLAVVAAVVVVGWWMGWLTQLTLWVPGITLSLVALYLVRRKIYDRRRRLRRRVEKYCEANDICPQLLCSYYDDEDTYPFFSAIFEEPPQGLLENRRAAER